MHPIKRPLNLKRQSIYLLPNLFTLGALFAGFYAIVQAMNGHFEHSAVAIFVAMILDGLDGRVARLTHTQSPFGAEFDSLSDMVSFGVAPALIAYEWALKDFGKLGWMVAFIYCAGAALRLARFNTNIEVVDKRFFQGLPSPSAAALVAGLVWISIEHAEDLSLIAGALPEIALFFTLFAGLTMVSNVKFWSFKEFHARKTVPFVALLVATLVLLIGASRPALVLFCFFIGYAASGYVYWGWQWANRHKKAVKSDM
ncbi:CDP-diacylglycerol--serine O-phosphatidyltransferase [Chitiniphilus shinanonensis]|uniref:CDP-diacylglycerol--serine O-phosphatidyltransferase n=1 Tax=Chitiniphilus shinanonensis TaxID=553088 RepID=A0ABQ6BRV0_9NEIS|nr:CDP-diacylglycerol--serine O-phosphatidyltransferase [Chitiniphilus shinanonensis]GLS03950.1 CDP-diacylglycerol--serine O-phosphatidyltransferase [Chitiniphilus shinanonensis]